MAKIHCYKGTGEDDEIVFDLNTQDKASDVRKQLTNAGFMPPDNERQNVGYRFVVIGSKSSTFQDAVLPEATEQYVPIVSCVGPGDQLIITNIYKEKKPDLVGIGTNWWFNQYIGVNCWLNRDDPTAIEKNAEIEAFEPFMLTNVKPTNPNIPGIYDNVCVCCDGAVVGFSLNSWGAAGFTYGVGPDKGQKIVGDKQLFATFDDYPDHYRSSTIQRYYDAPNTIQIVGTDEVNVPGAESLRYQKVTFKSWRMTSYTKGGKHFSSNTQPPILRAPGSLASLHADLAGATDTTTGVEKQVAKAGHVSTVPGDGIKPGTPVQGAHSQVTYGGPIYDPVTDEIPLGEVIVYFFVFKTHEDAVRTINGYNAPDPSIWD